MLYSSIVKKFEELGIEPVEMEPTEKEILKLKAFDKMGEIYDTTPILRMLLFIYNPYCTFRLEDYSEELVFLYNLYYKYIN